MTVGAIGSSASASSDAAAIQKQLKADQKTLTEDETKKAAEAQIDADEMKVQTDQQQLAAANKPKTSDQSADPAASTTSAVDAATISSSQSIDVSA